MPVKPEPYKRICPNCRWSQVVAPMSDVIISPMEMPQYNCPECSSATIKKPLNIWDEFKLLTKIKPF
ncbi:hypothetical protein BTA35_0202070 [Oceanospirillum linum]|uniref:Uncharacterized protein n=1 Tax=Oceanospirillum linum TaxID=966 RepID=A0A1T1HET2_OCELI|nr:hypothetical protein BTA35_0202070 [Oceanospirillum linum]SEF52398.1 hypothetical protein SAMN04489856_101425 [Oleiphilus messinensis]SMP04452.1 hypothetical protein SAMN06264348_101426 [Oceanospirillum linum]